MPMQPAPIWSARFDALSPASDPSWTTAMANLVFELSSSLQINEILPPCVFNFQKALFEQGMLGATPAGGEAIIAQAWASAISASTIIVASGSSIGAPSPATTFSAPPVVLILPPSVAAAQIALQNDLLAAPPSPPSAVGPAFYKAFTSLQVSVTGINSVAPTPTPLVLPVGTVS